MEKQGTKANTNGKGFERQIEDILKMAGLCYVPDLEKTNNGYSGPRYAKNVKYYSVLKRHSPLGEGRGCFNPKRVNRTEFVVAIGNRRIWIEAKKQSVSGSVFEKLPNLVANCRDAGVGKSGYYFGYPGKEVYFVFGGEVLESDGLNYMNGEIEEYSGKIDKKMYASTLEDFSKWILAEVEAAKNAC